MSVAREWFDWRASGLDWDRPPYESCSPNLQLLRAELDQRWPGGQFLGCEGDRPIRAGTTPSVHSWGAAFDWRYPKGRKDEILFWLIGWSHELGVQQIHDYLGGRIWRAGRTPNVADAFTAWWKPNTGAGFGDPWADYLHIETTQTRFADTTPIVDRLPRPTPPYLLGDPMQLQLATPTVRLYDSRNTGKRLDAGTSVKVPVGAPGAKAAFVTVTAVETLLAGFAAPGPVSPPPATSILNWTQWGQTIANTTLVAVVDGHIEISVHSGTPGPLTHLLIDLVAVCS